MSDIDDKKDALIATAKRCFDLRLQSNAGGNLSVRLDSRDAIVIKPSGVGFNECTRDNLQVVHLDGTIEPSEYKPSKDLDFHLDLYRIREDINAVVHCHSPWATGYASAGLEIPCLTVQTIEKIGRMPLIPLCGCSRPRQSWDDWCGFHAHESTIPRRDHRRNSPHRLCPRHADGRPRQNAGRLAAIWHRCRRPRSRLAEARYNASFRRPHGSPFCGMS